MNTDRNARHRAARRLNRMLELHQSGAKPLSKSEFTRCRRDIARIRAELAMELSANEEELHAVQARNMSAWWTRSSKQR